VRTVSISNQQGGRKSFRRSRWGRKGTAVSGGFEKGLKKGGDATHPKRARADAEIKSVLGDAKLRSSNWLAKGENETRTAW